MGRIVTSWQENGFQYTLTAAPIVNDNTEMISIFDYFGGKTQEQGTGERVYKAAVEAGARIDSKQVATKYYTGKVMLYERSFLDSHFNETNPVPVAQVKTIKINDIAEEDDLPF